MNILAKLREPSSIGGLALLLGVALPTLSPDTLQGVANVAQAVAGLALIVMREGARK